MRRAVIAGIAALAIAGIGEIGGRRRLPVAQPIRLLVSALRAQVGGVLAAQERARRREFGNSVPALRGRSDVREYQMTIL